MTQTLTTERLREIASSPSFSANPLSHEVKYMARELLASREAQPVGYIDPDSLKEYRGQRAGGTWSAVQRTTSGLNMTVPIYLTAPPAAAVPEDVRDALRYRFLKDKDAWGCDNAPGLVEWDGLIELEGNDFYAAIDARMANSDVTPFTAPPAPANVQPVGYLVEGYKEDFEWGPTNLFPEPGGGADIPVYLAAPAVLSTAPECGNG